ncbi:MAG: hypothetical protein GX421_03655 [Caldisericales bacterium]|nr:hypothetical protein [Caldisericales bacterium]
MIQITSTIFGNINGVQFQGNHGGTANTENGTSSSSIQFTAFPLDFTPLACRSWACKHHLSVCMETGGAINLLNLAGGNYDTEEIVSYPGGGQITTTSQVRLANPSLETCQQAFNGNIQITKEILLLEPFTEILTPDGPGRAIKEGSRRIVFSDDSSIIITWTGIVMFVDQSLELPFSQAIDYTYLSAFFDRQNLLFTKKLVAVARRT